MNGSISDGIHRLPVRVYYEDTDFSGNVYHANYLKFCERGRSDFLRVIGVDQNAMFDGTDSSMFVVRKMVCDFLRPAHFDDQLTVETAVGEMGGARFELLQKVMRGPDVLFTAGVTIALVDGRGRPRRISAALAGAFTQAFS